MTGSSSSSHLTDEQRHAYQHCTMSAVPASFQFVDHSAIDKKARRCIRSHVMKGKNVGKVRTPRRHLAATSAVLATAPKPKAVNRTQELAMGHEIDFFQASSSPKLLIQLGNELSGVKMPCSVSRQSRRFIHDCLCVSILSREIQYR